jgi:hypothetical protein
MELNGQCEAPVALPPREEIPVPTGQEAGWAPEPRSLASAEISAPTVEPVACRCTD